MTLRSFIFWPHLVAGITAGLVILVMCVTGVLLTYERQMSPGPTAFRSAFPAAARARLPVEDLLARVRAGRPDLAHPTARDRRAPTPRRAGRAECRPNAPLRRRLLRRDPRRAPPRRAPVHVGAQGLASLAGGRRGGPRRWRAPSPAGPTCSSSSSSSRASICGSRGKWTLAQRPAGRRCSRAACAARRATSTGTTSSASGRRFRSSSSSSAPCRSRFPGRNALVYRAVGEAGAGCRRRAEKAGAGREGARARRERRALPVRCRRARTGVLARAAAAAGARLADDQHAPSGVARAPVVFAIDRGNGGQPQLRSTLTLDRRRRGHQLRDLRRPDARPPHAQRHALRPYRRSARHCPARPSPGSPRPAAWSSSGPASRSPCGACRAGWRAPRHRHRPGRTQRRLTHRPRMLVARELVIMKHRRRSITSHRAAAAAGRPRHRAPVRPRRRVCRQRPGDRARDARRHQRHEPPAAARRRRRGPFDIAAGSIATWCAAFERVTGLAGDARQRHGSATIPSPGVSRHADAAAGDGAAARWAPSLHAIVLRRPACTLERGRRQRVRRRAAARAGTVVAEVHAAAARHAADDRRHSAGRVPGAGRDVAARRAAQHAGHHADRRRRRHGAPATTS